MEIDFNKINKIYFVGIKGVAMSGLAVIFKQQGFEVSGSDSAEKFITDEVLKKFKITVRKGFFKNNISKFKPDLVVVGTSFSKMNPEVKMAKGLNIKIILESDLRGFLSKQKYTVAVTGVHGKTTTTAWLAYIFEKSGLKPSYLYGSSTAYGLKANGQWQEGKHYIVEGDEYVKSLSIKKAKFLDLNPKITLITSLEWEHVDVYKNLASIEATFKKLVDKTIKNNIGRQSGK